MNTSTPSTPNTSSRETSTVEDRRRIDTVPAQSREPLCDLPHLASVLTRFKTPSRFKSVWQVANTLVPFCALWCVMYLSLSWSYWLTLLLAVPAAGLLVRLFIIQHDCGHHSFFRNLRTNDRLGAIFSLFTFTPYSLWRRSHSLHHASSGNLDHRGDGDVWILTVNEYRNRSYLARLQYRIYRNPLFLFVVGPTLYFVVRQRFTLGIPANWNRERRGVHLTNIGIIGLLIGAWCTIGVGSFLLVHVPIVVLAASIGSWLFYVQHQYEDAYWQGKDKWSFIRSAFEGSSYYQLPRVLHWFTGNIGYHHIHHFESRIPNYNLASCFEAVDECRQAVTLTLWDSLRCMRLKLWDETQQRMVTFNEVYCGRT